MLASLTLVLATGVVSPVAAAARNVTDHAALTNAAAWATSARRPTTSAS